MENTKVTAGPRIVGKGEFYEAKKAKGDAPKEIVCVFVVNLRDIGFAPIGSSKEIRMGQEEFLEAYDYLEPEAALAKLADDKEAQKRNVPAEDQK